MSEDENIREELHRQIYDGIRKYPFAFAMTGLLAFELGMMVMLAIVFCRGI